MYYWLRTCDTVAAELVDGVGGEGADVGVEVVDYLSLS